MTVAEQRIEALSRARGGQSTRNYAVIFHGFAAKGIEPADIDPRENVLTYRAWQALGRQVRKGEHGVKVCTIRNGESTETDPQTGEVTTRNYSTPWTATVFHVSQTDAIQADSAGAA